MKKLILLFVFSFSMMAAFAKCSSNGLSFYPKQKEISLHSQFIIEGYLNSQTTIRSFKNRSVYLESEKGDRIELNLQEILEGQMSITQAIFCTNTNLEPNTTYFLKFENQTEEETSEIMFYNSNTQKSESPSWTTTDQKELASLNSDLSLTFNKTEVIQYGCGPAANAIFKIKNNSDAEKWFKTEVVNTKTNQASSFYLKPRDNKLYVGNGMCSGAFLHHKKGAYKVRFTPMNTDG